MPTTVIIMRGPSGSGKTTLAEKIYNNFEGMNKKILSADNYHIDVDGNYNWKPENIKAAHLDCYSKFLMACGISYQLNQDDGIRGRKEEPCLIMVDNTNIKQWEFEKYVAIAKQLGFEIRYEIPEGDWIAEELAERNSHGVSLEICQRMIDNFEPNL